MTENDPAHSRSRWEPPSAPSVVQNGFPGQNGVPGDGDGDRSGPPGGFDRGGA